MSTISVSGKSGTYNKRPAPVKRVEEPAEMTLSFILPSLDIQNTVYDILHTLKSRGLELRWNFNFSQENKLFGTVQSKEKDTFLEVLTQLQRINLNPRVAVQKAEAKDDKVEEEDPLAQQCKTVTENTSVPKEPSCYLEELKREAAVISHNPNNLPKFGHGPSMSWSKPETKTLEMVGHFESDLSDDELSGAEILIQDDLSEDSQKEPETCIAGLLRDTIIPVLSNQSVENLRFNQRPASVTRYILASRGRQPNQNSQGVVSGQMPQKNGSSQYPPVCMYPFGYPAIPFAPELSYLSELPFMQAIPGLFESLQEDQQCNLKKMSRVVYVKGIEKGKLTIQQIANLFECFGDVEIAMLHTKREYAMVKFNSVHGARNCIKELYGKEIGGKSLLIHFSELETLVPKFYTNEKVYYVPKTELRKFQANKVSNHISRTLLVNFCSILEPPGLESRYISVAEAKKLIGVSNGLAAVRTEGTSKEFYVDFNCTKSAVEFVMNNNYKEFSEEGLFAMYTFASKTRWS